MRLPERTRTPWHSTLVAVLFGLAAVGCGPVEEDPIPDPDPEEDLEVLGEWADNWGGHTLITAERWGDSTLVKFDNEARFAITRNPANAAWHPEKYAKVVWTRPENGVWYTCMIAFGKDTAEEAENTSEVADDSAPEASGCGGFSWTRMFPPTIEVAGEWEDNWGGFTEIDNDAWGSSTIVTFSNVRRFAITQNPAVDEWNPSKFAKVVWTQPQDDTWYTCMIAFGKDTAEEAESTTEVADETDPETRGCGGFAWTRMFPPAND